ncbi:MAG: sigma-54 dependent transcriptional regulator [Clostridium sp.]|nr:sigma-54 dependent transcriptional regulator [Clostridium sp.]
MKIDGALLVIDDNKAILQAVETLARKAFAKVVSASRPDDIPALLRAHRPAVLLLDMNFRADINSGNEGLYWLRQARKISPSTSVVLFTAYADVQLAVTGMKEGAVDFVTKPFDNDALLLALTRAAKGGSQKSATAQADSQMLWGASPSMLRLREVVRKIAATEANVLITGENGTGKELLAKEIHRLSARAAAPIVTVDMGAVVETLFESELFGHAKGAFTDARADRPGKFEAASRGTLFLDEIGNLPYHLQAKLLSALQQRRITRVGSNSPIPIDIRLVCATNRDLPAMVSAGEFRQDLFYRINTIKLELPPLRERRDDIPVFARHFLDKYAKAYGKEPFTLLPDAAMAMMERPWAGNIRELEHVVEKAVIMADKPELDAADFDLLPDASPISASDAQTLESMERAMISRAVNGCEGNMSLAAKQLGITRQTLYNKMKKYGL